MKKITEKNHKMRSRMGNEQSKLGEFQKRQEISWKNEQINNKNDGINIVRKQKHATKFL